MTLSDIIRCATAFLVEAPRGMSIMQNVLCHIQLFRQRLSYESVKAYALMPIGIMGSKSLALLDWGSRWFSNKERERINTCLCCFLPPRWNTLRFTQATLKTAITHYSFRDCRVSFSPFVRQPFSKQLYMALFGFWSRPKHANHA